MSLRLILLAVCYLLLQSIGLRAEAQQLTDVLKGLREGHPRVMVTEEALGELRKRALGKGECGEVFGVLRGVADRVLGEEVVGYEIPDGLRLLAVAGRVLDRVQVLGCVFLVTGEEKYRERMWEELEAAAGFPDWNTRHFLDTATLCRAFGVAYDWLFDEWSDKRKRVIRGAMVEKALLPAVKVLEEKRWWATGRNNWTQVCAGGVVLGALAIADEEPELASRVVKSGVEALRRGAVHYAPDGGWYEAPGYWHYATRYFVAALLGMETALGHDFGLGASKGFRKTWMFPLYMCGPSERVFNYGDCGLGRINAWELFYFAERDGADACAEWQARQAAEKPSPLDLLFWRDPVGKGAWKSLDLDAQFQALDVASMRSAWGEKMATFVGVKGGRNGLSHGQLDLGGFVFATAGERWAVEMGRENYNVPGYWNMGKKGKRWTYYRCRAEGGNTLVINPGKGPDQNVRARARIVRSELQTSSPHVVMDLSAAYGEKQGRVQRGFQLVDRKGLLIVDEMSLASPSEVYWFVHNRTKVKLSDDGRVARLRRGKKRCEFRILEPREARWTLGAAAPLPTSPRPQGNNPNAGYSRLAIHLSAVSRQRVAVWMAPAEVAVPLKLAQTKLAEW